MGWFKKKDKVLDLTEYYKKRKEEISPDSQTNAKVIDLTSNSNSQSAPANSADNKSSGGFFGSFFGFGGSNESTTDTPETASESSSPDLEERRQKLVKRLTYMTDKLEEISNQIYRLQQRVELLEKKANLDTREF